MMREELYLIKICSAYLGRQAINLEESVDYSRLFSVTREHNLLAIAYCVIKNADNKSIVHADIYKRFEDAFFETIIRYDAQSAVKESLDKILCDNEIRHIFFKGAQIRDYYPVPEARAMGDIDILIEPEQRDKVRNLLTSNGYMLKNSNGPVYDYIKDGVLIEMHTSLVNGKVGNSCADEYFKNAVDMAEYDGYRGSFDANYHFAYLLTHIAHHFWFYGAGIKLILDLAVMEKRFDIDHGIVMAHMQKLGLEQFARVILTVCYKWFGVGEDFGADTSVTEKFITYFGAFGNSKRNNASVVQRKELEEGKHTSPLLTRLRLIFPSYSKLKDIPYIKFINGRPYLLPLAWIYRIVYNIRYRRAFVTEVNSSIGSDVTNAMAHKELEYFEEIGLL